MALNSSPLTTNTAPAENDKSPRTSQRKKNTYTTRSRQPTGLSSPFLQGQIDKPVFELNGLTKKEIKIVDGRMIVGYILQVDTPKRTPLVVCLLSH